MGLYKRKDSHYYWMALRIKGRKANESTGTNNLKLAKRIYVKRLTEIAEGKWFDKNTLPEVTMGEILDRYMSEISPNLSPTTNMRNLSKAKNLKAFFGATLLQDVTASTVSAYKAKCLEKGYSKETILRELGLLRRIFNISIFEWELCKENPVPKALRTLGKVDSKRVRYLNADELERLTTKLPDWLKPIVTIARHTGLRRSNILEMTWDQVNLTKRTVIIPRTKNGSPLGMPLTQTAAQILAKILETKHTTSPFVFCDMDGKPFSPDAVSQAFIRARKKAKIENLRFHDLRHDFASRLVQNGVSIHVVRELLGHSDLRMTIRYSHLAPENLSEAVKILDQQEKNDYVLTTFDKNGVRGS